MTDKLVGSYIYSKIDLISAFNQIHIREANKWKTAFCTTYGLYKYLVMPFGLSNVPATFQSFINHILYQYLNLLLVFYLDNILVYSLNQTTYQEYLSLVFKELLKYELFVKPKKSEFFVDEVEFLGYKI